MPRSASKSRSTHHHTLGRHVIITGALLAVLLAMTAYLVLAPSPGRPAADAGAAAAASDADEPAGAPPPVVFDPVRVDFGEMPVNVTHTMTARVVNTGSSTLRLLTGRTSCGCLRIDVPPTAIPPGGREELTLHMDSQSQPGLRTVTASVFFVGHEQPAVLNVQRTTVAE